MDGLPKNIVVGAEPICKNCGWDVADHDPKTGTCLKGGWGEDATGYEPLTEEEKIKRGQAEDEAADQEVEDDPWGRPGVHFRDISDEEAST